MKNGFDWNYSLGILKKQWPLDFNLPFNVIFYKPIVKTEFCPLLYFTPNYATFRMGYFPVTERNLLTLNEKVEEYTKSLLSITFSSVGMFISKDGEVYVKILMNILSPYFAGTLGKFEYNKMFDKYVTILNTPKFTNNNTKLIFLTSLLVVKYLSFSVYNHEKLADTLDVLNYLYIFKNVINKIEEK